MRKRRTVKEKRRRAERGNGRKWLRMRPARCWGGEKKIMRVEKKEKEKLNILPDENA